MALDVRWSLLIAHSVTRNVDISSSVNQIFKKKRESQVNVCDNLCQTKVFRIF